jgi:putative membrane protein
MLQPVLLLVLGQNERAKQEDLMWWDYWPMPFFFGPWLIILMAFLCIGMMMFMMRGHRHSPGHRALDILSECYARGEIDAAEYEERRRVLRA